MLFAFKADKPAYMIYTAKGKTADYKDMLEKAIKSDIVLFGELHNNPICHWLELQLSNDIFKSEGDKTVMGAEMFEADNQLLLNEYLDDIIPQKNFEAEARLWDNYKTDYKPLVELAKTSKIPFIATNIPRRYAAVVSKHGFEGLDSLMPQAYEYIVPLPVKYDPELKGYKDMLKNMGDMGGGHTGVNLPKAQAIKDATMAYFILKNWKPGKIFIHFNGSYHSNNFEGIYWYLKQENPSLKITTIASVEQDDIEKLDEDSQNLADFIICIPSDMTKTY